MALHDGQLQDIPADVGHDRAGMDGRFAQDLPGQYLIANETGSPDRSPRCGMTRASLSRGGRSWRSSVRNARGHGVAGEIAFVVHPLASLDDASHPHRRQRRKQEKIGPVSRGHGPAVQEPE